MDLKWYSLFVTITLNCVKKPFSEKKKRMSKIGQSGAKICGNTKYRFDNLLISEIRLNIHCFIYLHWCMYLIFRKAE